MFYRRFSPGCYIIIGRIKYLGNITDAAIKGMKLVFDYDSNSDSEENYIGTLAGDNTLIINYSVLGETSTLTLMARGTGLVTTDHRYNKLQAIRIR